MTDHRGPELVPGSPEYDWVAGIIKAVGHRMGVPSRWNGRLYEETDPRFVGAAGVDGCMTVSEPDVLAPARSAYTGDRLSGDEGVRARDAVATVAHEAVHLCSRAGDRDAPDAHPTRDAPGEALDEGLTEIWTHRNLSSIIRDVDMDRFAPAVIGRRTLDAYPAYTAAANGLVDGMAIATGRPRADITRAVITTDLAQRWNHLADLALAGLDPMPAGQRSQVRRELADRLRADFARAHEIQSSPDLDNSEKSRRGWHIGRQSASNLEHGVARIGPQAEVAHLQAMVSGHAPARFAPRTSPAVRAGHALRTGHVPRTQATTGRQPPGPPIPTRDTD